MVTGLYASFIGHLPECKLRGTYDLKPQKLADKTIMLILNKAIAGGSEGVTSDILKWAMDDVYDLLTGQSESRWKQDIREKQRQGMSFRGSIEGKDHGDRSGCCGRSTGKPVPLADDYFS